MKKIMMIVLIIILILSFSACSTNPDTSNSPQSDLTKNHETTNEMAVRTFSSTKGFSSEVHVLSSDKGNILVDPGFYDDNLAEYVKSVGGLDAILIIKKTEQLLEKSLKTLTSLIT